MSNTTKDLKHLLMRESTSDGRPLFSNAIKLGEAIIALGNQAHYKNPKTVGSLACFIFRKERSCSDEFRTAIIDATRKRLKNLPRDEREKWILAIGRTIDQYNLEMEATSEQRSEPDEKQFIKLLDCARKAEEHFIITSTTAEEESSQHAQKLSAILMERLGIFHEGQHPPETRYNFLLPNRETGRRFWHGLRGRCLKDGRSSESQLDERIQWLDENRYLNVFIVPPYVCGVPLVVFNPELRYPEAFSFGYHQSGAIDVVEWDLLSIHQWKRNVHERFEQEDRTVPSIQEVNPLSSFLGYKYGFY